MRVSRARQPAEATHVGIIVCGVVGILFGGLALSVDVPKASQGFKSDVATYYSLAPQSGQRPRFSIRPVGSDEGRGGVSDWTRGDLSQAR